MAKSIKTIPTFNSLEPTNINEAIEYYKSFINAMYITYWNLIDVSKEPTFITNPYSQRFNDSIAETFKNKFDKNDLLFFIKKYLLSATNTEQKTLDYNYIFVELTDLKSTIKRLKYNPQYPSYKDLMDNKTPSQILFINRLINDFEGNINEDGNYIDTDRNYFEADTFYYTILKDIDIAIEQVNSLYTKKELNNFMPTNTPTQPTHPQKEIQPIKWQKNSVLLAYLINELKTYGFIDEDSIWAICEQIFVDKKGNPIKAKTFTSMVKNYENNNTTDGKKGKPKTHTEITDLIQKLKAISKEIE